LLDGEVLDDLLDEEENHPMEYPTPATMDEIIQQTTNIIPAITFGSILIST
jgi:hypothetical protein